MNAVAGTAAWHVTRTFEDCYRRHWGRVYRLALRYGAGDREWAEDLAHDVFVRLLERFGQVQRQGDPGAWLYRVTANLAISQIRRKKSWLGRLSLAWRSTQPSDSPSPELAVHCARALRSLEALPAQERVVMCMRVMDDMAQKDIAQTLDMSEGYVSKLLSRAVTRLRADGWEVDDA